LHALDVYFTKYDYRSDALRLLEDFMTNDDNCWSVVGSIIIWLLDKNGENIMQNEAFECKKIKNLVACWFMNDHMLKMNGLEW